MNVECETLHWALFFTRLCWCEHRYKCCYVATAHVYCLDQAGVVCVYIYIYILCKNGYVLFKHTSCRYAVKSANIGSKTFTEMSWNSEQLTVANFWPFFWGAGKRNCQSQSHQHWRCSVYLVLPSVLSLDKGDTAYKRSHNMRWELSARSCKFLG